MVNVLTKFKKGIKGRKNFIALALVDSKNYQKTNIQLLRTLIKGRSGVYVTINKPYVTMKAILEKEKINTKLIIFIDAITKLTKGSTKKDENCLYLDNPQSLTDISVAITEALNSIKAENKFIFLDSLSTLLIYNHAGTIAKFVHFLTGRMRTWGIDGIIISLESESDKALIAKLSQFCDVTINFVK
jgi:KaiC/GvpD/RAD55 family RecA-like ATPase